MGARLGVVYLVWGPLGSRPLADFLAAYREHVPGVGHELIVVFNGVARESERGPGAATRAALLAELEGVEHRLLELERPVLDLAAYLEAAKRLEHDQLCFLNSYSEPLLDGWLALLAAPAEELGVGMVGATGSWASQSSHARYTLGLGGPYARVHDDRERVKRLFAPSREMAVTGSPTAGEDAAGEDTGEGRTAAAPPKRHPLRAALLIARQPRFPAPHLRTNAFLLERELLLRVEPGTLHDKAGAYLLESGRRSLTRQIERRGLRVLVAGRDGASYGPREWPSSRTFWQGSQENLIVADNQTRSYERGDLGVRRALSAHAWGELAAPAEPDSPGDAPASCR
jgi:hypothetical protein